MPDRSLRKGADAVQPGFAIIERYFDSLDLVSKAIEGEPFDAVLRAFLNVLECYFLTLVRHGNDGVQILAVESCVRVMEHCRRQFALRLGDEAGYSSIVPDMIVRIILLVAYPDLLQPVREGQCMLSG